MKRETSWKILMGAGSTVLREASLLFQMRGVLSDVTYH